ncbi:MAG: hypothetical protein JW883_12145 [Deltaproteobacteria bacterium]|nr:hypothetical protein [Deltaproteobacteria bacterium]
MSGKLDGLVFMVGMMSGVFIFAEIFPVLKRFYMSGDMGTLRLPQVLKLHSGIIAFLVCLMVVGAFWLGEKTEQRFQTHKPEGAPKRRFKLAGSTILVLLGPYIADRKP